MDEHIELSSLDRIWIEVPVRFVLIFSNRFRSSTEVVQFLNFALGSFLWSSDWI